MSAHTPGPWRWEVNRQNKHLQLVGGLRPQYDLTIIAPTRWGMGSGTLLLRDTAHDGLNLLHKLHERADWIEPIKGREHHAAWCATVAHPDARLIAAAPDLLDALSDLISRMEEPGCADHTLAAFLRGAGVANARAAIAKARGSA
ncbi:MAG: hypothetical protein ACRC2H_01005 [Silanimonas sp.]